MARQTWVIGDSVSLGSGFVEGLAIKLEQRLGDRLRGTATDKLGWRVVDASTSLSILSDDTYQPAACGVLTAVVESYERQP